MTELVDIKSPEFEAFLDNKLTEKLNAFLSEKPPESQVAIMLQAHLTAFGEFRLETRNRFDTMDAQFQKIDDKFKKVGDQFKKVDARFDKVEARLANIENTMVTKEDLKKELDANNIRLLKGIHEIIKEKL